MASEIADFVFDRPTRRWVTFGGGRRPELPRAHITAVATPWLARQEPYSPRPSCDQPLEVEHWQRWDIAQ
jgi:hypothetical protein